MKINADYHTHTVYSHGKGGIEDNVLAALNQGLSRIAIADHGFGHAFYGVNRHAMVRMRREIDRLNEKYDGRIQVLLGMEFNVLGMDECDIPADTSLFDIILLGYHKGAFSHSAQSKSWRLRNMAYSPRMRKENAEVIASIMEKHNVAILTHPGEYIPLDMEMTARAAAQLGVAIEINARHPSLTVDELHLAQNCGAKFVVDSDAHKPEHVGGFSGALELIKKAGIDEANIVNTGACNSNMRFSF